MIQESHCLGRNHIQVDIGNQIQYRIIYLLIDHIELENLTSGNVLHALLEQIYIVFPVVLRYSLAEKVVS